MVISYINSHHTEFWFIIGFVLLGIEVITGLTTGIFLFSGFGALATGLLMLVGILPETWTAGVASLGISSGIITFLLWKPLRNMQGSSAIEKDNSSDLIGHEFVVEQDITTLNSGTTHYSGVEWKVILDRNAGVEEIKAGKYVKVSSVDVGKFYVIPA